MTFLNPQVILPNPYSLPVVLLALVILIFGVVVLTKEHGSPLGSLFLLFAVSVSVYFFGAGVSYAVVSPARALSWERFAHIGVTAIPATLLCLSLSITGVLKRNRVAAWLSVGVTALFVSALLFTDRFIAGNTRYFWGFYPVYGQIGILYIAFFVSTAVASLALFINGLRKATTELYKRRMRGLILAFSIGYVGGVDFLPALGVEVYAFGYIPVTAFVLVLGIVVLRYRLIDISPAIAAPQILATMPSGVLVTDTLGMIRIVNNAAAELFGLSATDLTGRRAIDLLAVDDSKDRRDGQLINPSPSYIAGAREVTVQRMDGTYRTLSVTTTMLTDHRNRAIGSVQVAADVTALKEAAAEMRRLALYDPLTGLPNRVLFFDRLEHLTEKLQRNGGSLAIFYVDLNAFKTVNDTYGHTAGDTVLGICAQRMLSTTRSSDTLARIGGDEFVQICDGVSSREDAALIAGKMIEKLDEPINLEKWEVKLGGSIGIAFFPEHASTVEKLMIAADAAMYRAKERKTSAWEVARPSEGGEDSVVR